MSEEIRQIRLLIVEDDEDDYILTEALLGEASTFDFRIDWAATLEQAHQQLARNDHHICLMDYRLGAEVGLDLVRRASDLGFTGPIIMLTGQDDSGVEIEAAEAGAADYLVKDGLNTPQLVRAIRYALARLEIQSEREERARAESRNRAKTEFLANLSHEIRTPLTAIIGYTELMLQEASASETFGNKLEVVNRNSRHLMSLLNDTLDLSRIEAGRMEIEIKPMNLAAFLADIQSLVKASAAEKALEFRLEFGERLPLDIHSDATRLRQILLNLCTNAIKFTDEGHVRLVVSFDENRKDGLLFSICDSGIGIPEDKLESIFSPFVQQSGERARLGTGLGLTISRHLAGLLGGKLSAESEPGKGSCFTLSIDPGETDPAGMGVPDLVISQTMDTDRQLPPRWQRALVVDDVEDIRLLVTSILTRAGLQCDTASDGREALGKLTSASAGDYDLLIMDINMPGMDGKTAVSLLRQSGSAMQDLPALALTAANVSGIREECLAAGFDGFVAKPLSVQSMLDTVESLEEESRSVTEQEDAVSILIVEDHEDTRVALIDMLDMLGHRAVGAGTTEDALRLLGEHPVSHVLTDAHLGEQDGVKLAADIKDSHPTLKVILITGDQRLSREPPAEADGVILKPVSLAQLQQLLA